jgi:hypothetical protein
MGDDGPGHDASRRVSATSSAGGLLGAMRAAGAGVVLNMGRQVFLARSTASAHGVCDMVAQTSHALEPFRETSDWLTNIQPRCRPPGACHQSSRGHRSPSAGFSGDILVGNFDDGQ